MVKKILGTFMVMVFAVTISVGAIVWITLKMMEWKEERESLQAIYERKLWNDNIYGEMIENAISEEKMRDIFQYYNLEFQQLAEGCKKNEIEQINFFIKYIDQTMFYVSDYPVTRIIQDDEYVYVTKFMDFATGIGLCNYYNDWMFQISLFNLENQEGKQDEGTDDRKITLKVTFYKGECLEAAFWYSPYEEEDYSGTVHITTEEGFEKVEKLVQLDPNWYYFYSVTDNPNYWHPEIPLD
ncbi:hypothetical protein D3Z58_15345 [Clostridiaceae bacterium]|nr:hypothetical protein [Lachnospiraceae bacterium]NBH16138.1 hypothetical protein [Clostridiaceae bacterium]NBH34900.1 hypothetical protein [Clostridiaceae bacterium]